MGLDTIMGHLDDANSDLCFRSLSNLNNQKVTPDELTRECHKRGWHCMLANDRVYIAKTEWTSQLLTQRQPCVIVAQGTQVLDFLRSRILPVKAKLVEGVHHADRKSNEDKQRRLLRVRETIEECVGDRRQN